ncbi:FAD-dependent oxidoreductase [Parendozoicomonas haliclonae]|uniref:sn-glycerol-3-phosphate dehydrogenase subunit A n=1 Tax=Parendozoicomonas haliclonae TaxID=1960125 RepID=A0A1X7AG31_9GAMM|nr:FAD-dependent oxidoreductase [Parendozoicomonas haliclonae]SMA37730.1 sn-glycerol-3-phosphate dehydrogenase subunit A [Parendozoicomonas haliclonae]
MNQVVAADVTIIGGGIAGLWLFRRLNNMGYKALLLENDTLGGGQTIKSQGIIHGGIKYALSGNLTKASECIAGMPARWQAAMRGDGELDLTNVRVLSDHQYMWTPGGFGSRLATFFGSKALRGRVEGVSKSDLPEAFRNPQFKGKLYKLSESVLDVETVIEALVKGLEDRMIKVDWNSDTTLKLNDDHSIAGIEITQSDKTTVIESKQFVFTAGEGTADLLKLWQQDAPQQQVRPLHMVMMEHDFQHPVYAHCVGTDIVPRITITSHPTKDGRWVWYMGGELAETGVKREADEQIALAKKELTKLMPWVDFGRARWGTLRVNRAEPKQNKLLRPDAAFCKPVHNGLVTWPTKLALAPNLADEVIKSLEAQGITPEGNEGFSVAELPHPEITKPFWEGRLQD